MPKIDDFDKSIQTEVRISFLKSLLVKSLDKRLNVNLFDFRDTIHNNTYQSLTTKGSFAFTDSEENLIKISVIEGHYFRSDYKDTTRCRVLVEFNNDYLHIINGLEYRIEQHVMDVFIINDKQFKSIRFHSIVGQDSWTKFKRKNDLGYERIIKVRTEAEENADAGELTTS